MPTVYPCAPGHGIVGRVTSAGCAVRKFKEGDLVAVGCMVDSCRIRPACREGVEQFCDALRRPPTTGPTSTSPASTFGGYSESIVADEPFVLRVSDQLNPADVAPLVCAGITTYSPLRHRNVRRGQRVDEVGLGGLGHMAVKFAHVFGARVVVFTTSPGKIHDAVRLGADEVVVSRNAAEMQKHSGTFDFILDTVSAAHDLNAYLVLLKREATMTDPPGFIGHQGSGGIRRQQSAQGMGSGEGFSLPQRGSRAKPALSWLKRSAAFRGQSPREEGVKGEETHGLLRVHDEVQAAT